MLTHHLLSYQDIFSHDHAERHGHVPKVHSNKSNGFSIYQKLSGLKSKVTAPFCSSLIFGTWLTLGRDLWEKNSYPLGAESLAIANFEIKKLSWERRRQGRQKRLLLAPFQPQALAPSFLPYMYKRRAIHKLEWKSLGTFVEKPTRLLLQWQ